MNYFFIFVQFIGILAWLILVFSYYRKDTNAILVFHIISALLFSIHYFLLGAYSGLLICIYEVIRDFLYYKTDKDNIIFLGSIIVYVLSLFFTYKTVLDILPFVASLTDGFFLTKKRDIVILGSIFIYIIWFIYDMHALSYSGAITDGILIISNLLILFLNIDIFEGKNIRRV